MTQNYITLSLETHLFFSRIMKEHALFLEAGFPCKNDAWIERADFFRLISSVSLGLKTTAGYSVWFIRLTDAPLNY